MKNIFRNFLRRKQNGSKTWYDITTSQFDKMSKIGDKLTLEDALRIIYGIELNDIPVSELHKYDMSFMGTEVPREPIKKFYKLNGTKYYANFDTTKMTTAQFVDFQNYTKNNDFIGCLSVCLRPKGSNYNDGSYDIEKLKTDIRYMSITQALTISFFFKLQLAVLLEATQQSLASQLKETETDKNLIEAIKTLDLASLVFCQ